MIKLVFTGLISFCVIFLFNCVPQRDAEPKPIDPVPGLNVTSTPSSLTNSGDTHKVFEVALTEDSVVLQEGVIAYTFNWVNTLASGFRVRFYTIPSVAGLTFIPTQYAVQVSGTIYSGAYTLYAQIQDSAGILVSDKEVAKLFVKAQKKMVGGIALAPFATVPRNLHYANTLVSTTFGNTASSAVPEVEGTFPMKFYLYENTNPWVEIDSLLGVIKARSGLAVGTYPLSVKVQNAAGATLFAHIFTIQVLSNSIAPSQVSYQPSGLVALQGSTGTSGSPSFAGTLPVQFSIQTTPPTPHIHINSLSGVISYTHLLTSGTYQVQVTVSNEAGSTTQPNAFTIQITDPLLPTGLVYNPSSVQIVAGNTATSNIPQLSGTPPFTFSIASNVPPGVSISSTNGQISASQNLAAGVYSLDVTVSNTAGSQIFANAFVLSVTGSVPSYATQIGPLLQTYNCTACHGYTYNTARAQAGPASNSNSILNRINRAQGSTGFMPRNGTKMTQQQIDLIQQWFDTGMNP